jgi:hypothetical protein
VPKDVSFCSLQKTSRTSLSVEWFAALTCILSRIRASVEGRCFCLVELTL